jgi:magnesium transporter
MGDMITRYTHDAIMWVDVENPTKEEIFSLSHEFNLHPLVASELPAPSMRPKVDAYGDALYLILHFPALRHTHCKEFRQEIDFIIGEKYLITVHYDTIDALHKFSKEFEVTSLLDKHHIGNHAGYVFFSMVKKMYRSLEHELESVETRLKSAEAKIFKGNEDEMVAELSYINRDLLDFKQAIRPHAEVLKIFETISIKFFGDDFAFYARSIFGEYYKTANMLEGHKEMLKDLRETNDSLLTTKTGTIMKRLTFVSFATFPPMLIASVFGMNATHTPLMGKVNDFWLIISLMFITTSTIIVYFFYKKWL